MRTIQIKLFSFDELSEEGKQKAIDHYRNVGHNLAWTEENRNTLEAFEKILPINISNWSYGDRSEGVSFSVIGENIGDLSGQRLATYLWNNYRHDLFRGRWYSTCFDRKTNTLAPKVGIKSKNRRSNIILEHDCVLTGYYMDEVILEPIYKFLEKPIKGTTFEDLLQDCFSAWIKACDEDIEFQNSEEYIAEHFEANNMEFEEDGTIH